MYIQAFAFSFFSSILSLFYSSSVEVRRQFMADLFRMLFPEHDSLIKETIIRQFCLSLSSFSPLLSFPSFVFLFHSTHIRTNSNTFQHRAPCELRRVSVGECMWVNACGVKTERKKNEKRKPKPTNTNPRVMTLLLAIKQQKKKMHHTPLQRTRWPSTPMLHQKKRRYGFILFLLCLSPMHRIDHIITRVLHKEEETPPP